MKKAIPWIVAICVIVAAILVVANLMSSSGDTTPQGHSTTVAEPSGTNPPTTPPDNTGGTPNSAVSNANSEREAVITAALAMDELSQSQFLQRPQMMQVINNTVIAENRATYQQAFAVTGLRLAVAFGYTNIDDARLFAAYFVGTQKYRVDDFKAGNSASIRLYTITHWIISDGKDYQAPDIRVVKLLWREGKWLFVATDYPPAAEMPKPQVGLSFTRTVQTFLPFVKEFNNYESVDTG